jgi:MFS family permease
VTITIQSVFGVAGAAVAGRLAKHLGDAGLMTLGLTLFTAACSLLAIPSTPVALSAIALLGCSIPWFLIACSTAIQKATPMDLVGRVSGANTLAAMIPQSLGNMVGAALVVALSYKLIALLLASLLALTTAYVASRPALKRSRRDSARLAISTDRPLA